MAIIIARSRYRAKAAAVAAKINAAFLNESTGAYAVSPSFPENHRPGGTAEAAAHKASQAGQGMALFEGIVPDALRPDALQVRRSMHQGCLLKPRNFVFYPFLTHFSPFFAHFLRLDARNPENTARSPGENGKKSIKIGENRGN